MAHTVQQPMAENPLIDWSTGLCDCFEDASTCCYGFWCCPCLAFTVSGRFGENNCLPLCDICSPAILTACGIPCFVPPALLSLRASMRNRYGIKGSICKDIPVSCFCIWCAWCQMHRELKHRKKIPTVVNAQPHTFVNAQPPTFVNAQPPTFVNAQPPTFDNAQPHTFVNAQQNAPQMMAPQPVFMSQPFMVSY